MRTALLKLAAGVGHADNNGRGQPCPKSRTELPPSCPHLLRSRASQRRPNPPKSPQRGRFARLQLIGESCTPGWSSWPAAAGRRPLQSPWLWGATAARLPSIFAVRDSTPGSTMSATSSSRISPVEGPGEVCCAGDGRERSPHLAAGRIAVVIPVPAGRPARSHRRRRCGLGGHITGMAERGHIARERGRVDADRFA